MANQKFTNYEQETIINFNRAESDAQVYTADPVLIRKLDRFCNEQPEYFSCDKVSYYSSGEVASKTYKVASKKLISIRKKAVAKEMTEEQRKAASERLLEMRKKKGQTN